MMARRKIAEVKRAKVYKRIFLILIAFLLCLAGCEKSDRPTLDDSFDDDFLPVIANPQSTTKPNQSKPGSKRVALTFDDGPHNTRTKLIVDELDKYGYHATFFVLGNRVDGSEYNGAAAMKYAYEHGNEIAIHGYTHKVYYDGRSTDAQYERELSKTHSAITSVLPDYEVKLMRPIGGAITGKRVQSCPYSVIMWNVDSQDWKFKDDVEKIVDNVMSSVSDGSIVLMHDIHESTYAAAVIIINELHEAGYEIVTVSELIGDPKPATKYSKG